MNNLYIKKKCKKVKNIFLKLILSGSKYHLGGSLSCLEIICTLVYNKYIFLSKNGFRNFILSKGHALGILHSILIEKKFISEKKLLKYKKKNLIGNQLDIFSPKKNMFTWNSGSLGHSLGIAIGIAIANKKKVWTIIGDAEFDEGSIWEALFFISDKNLKNLIIIVDKNNISASSKINNKKILDKSFLKKLNINVFSLKGHNIGKLVKVFSKANKINKSSLIICETIKGNGIKEIENSLKYSYQLPNLNLIKKYVQ